MKKYLTAFCSGVAVTAILSAGAVPGFGANSTTGQGIMVNFNAAGDFAVSSTNTYKFNKVTASGYFTNVWDGNAPTCSPSNKCPAVSDAPAAPAPDASKVNSGNPGKNDVTGLNECAFLTGASLAGDTYTRTADVGTQSDKHTYTYTYLITPTVAATDPFTAWDLIDSTGGGTSAHVDVTANIAGESAVNNTNNSKIGLKYSFDLGTTASPRVVGVSVAVDTVPYAVPTVTIAYPVDFTYITNAGSNGNVGYLVNGDARTILNTDAFAGNNNGGADGSALALASTSTVGLDLTPGIHSVTLTGVVKTNSALADLPINITQTATVITPGCAPPVI
jgi:hypothetical protein